MVSTVNLSGIVVIALSFLASNRAFISNACLARTILLTAKSVDPFDGVKVNIPQENPKDRFRGKKPTNSIKKRGTKPIQDVEIAAVAKYSKVGLDVTANVEEKILAIESKILRRLPYDLMQSFSKIAENAALRFSYISFLAYTLMLIPGLRIIRFKLDMNVLPFLYIAPALIIFPFAAYWFWENGYSNDYITNLLRNFVARQKKWSTEQLKLDGSRLSEIAQEDISSSKVKDYAWHRLLSKIDCDVLASEIRELLRRKRSIRLREVFDDPNFDATFQPPYWPNANFNRIKTKGLVQNSVVSEATEALVENLYSMKGKFRDDEELIVQLKEFQEELKAKEK